jgi:trimeric autotransporter adhesin
MRVCQRPVICAAGTLRGALWVSVLAGTAAAQPCQPQWSSEFDEFGLDGRVRALTVFDDGGGADLYAGGDFRHAAGAPAGSIARWDGVMWSSLGIGLRGTNGTQQGEGYVATLCAFDDGTGPALYAGGEFGRAGSGSAGSLARWSGTSWTGLFVAPDPILCPECPASVNAMAVFDDGTGPGLYITGHFDDVEGVLARSAARWDGNAWGALGLGLVGVRPLPAGSAMAVYREQGRDALFVGGLGQPREVLSALNISRWDGLSWSALSSGLLAAGLRNSLPGVHAMVVFNDGSGQALYAGGAFSRAGGIPVENLARWDGQRWQSIGDINGAVNALAVFNDGRGPALFVGGEFTSADGVAARNIARWDGNAWEELPGGTDGPVWSLSPFDADGPGHRPASLYIGGEFSATGWVATQNIGAWTACTTPCHADCDSSTGQGVLDILDFLCFQNRFAAGSAYACECDTSSGPGVCDVFDFLCYQNEFAAGCP